MTEALGRDWAFAGRPEVPSFHAAQRVGTHFNFPWESPSPRWKFLRKALVKALGLFAASGRSRLEALMGESCESFHADIRGSLGEPFRPQRTVFECVSGVMGAMCFGIRFDRRHPLLLEVLEGSAAFSRLITVGSVLDYVPLGGWLMRTRVERFLAAMAPSNRLISAHIRQHKRNQVVEDIADALEEILGRTSDEEKREAGIVDDDWVRMVTQPLFGAGFVTVMLSFLWLLKLMAVFEGVQDKVQGEIDERLGAERPRLSDRPRLPYAEATMREMFRFVSLLPLGLPHGVTRDTSFRGFFVPRGAVVVANLWAVHRDPEVFECPDGFRPERFLDPAGGLRHDLLARVHPFGVGKRRCVGEAVAVDELFLLFAGTLQKFRLRPVPGEALDLEASEAGFERAPPPFRLIFSSRTRPESTE